MPCYPCVKCGGCEFGNSDTGLAHEECIFCHHVNPSSAVVCEECGKMLPPPPLQPKRQDAAQQ